jgi:hypothetical protein
LAIIEDRCIAAAVKKVGRVQAMIDRIQAEFAPLLPPKTSGNCGGILRFQPASGVSIRLRVSVGCLATLAERPKFRFENIDK